MLVAETRSQFTFYDSFYRALSRIKKKADRADAYDAIVTYALTGVYPDLDKLPDAAAIAFEVIKPNLDASRKKAASGKQGGKAKKQTASKPQANESTGEANGKQVKEQVQEQDKEQVQEQVLYSPAPSAEQKPKASSEETELARLSAYLRPVMEQWLEYKKQRKEKYAPAGLKALVTEVINNAGKYGEYAVAQVVQTSMASGYKGIVFDRLAQQTGRGRKEPVPSWADKQPSDWQKDAVRRMMEQEKNAGNDPELAERAEKLRERLGG
jgi:hypothetical protein